MRRPLARPIFAYQDRAMSGLSRGCYALLWRTASRLTVAFPSKKKLLVPSMGGFVLRLSANYLVLVKRPRTSQYLCQPARCAKVQRAPHCFQQSKIVLSCRTCGQDHRYFVGHFESSSWLRACSFRSRYGHVVLCISCWYILIFIASNLMTRNSV